MAREIERETGQSIRESQELVGEEGAARELMVTT
jgi:hypothetical protein